jgi:hypothetical protein
MTRASRPPLGASLLHPIALLALALLLANDHLLKARYPGFVTGKLSDLAGLIVAPLVLVATTDFLAPASLLRRRDYARVSAWLCALVVAGAFAATKTWAPATRAYEAMYELARAPLRWLVACALSRAPYGERIVLARDPTDLFALPMAVVAALIARPGPIRARPGCVREVCAEAEGRTLASGRAGSDACTGGWHETV